MTIKLYALNCIFIFSLLLCGCSTTNARNYNNIFKNNLPNKNLTEQQNNDIKNLVDDAMTALKNLDMENFNIYTNNQQIMETPWGNETIEYTLFSELCNNVHSKNDLAYQLDTEIVKNLSWHILDIKQSKDKAVVKLQITNLDLEGIFQKTLNFSENEIDLEMIKEIKKIPINCTKTFELNMEAEKQNEKWILLIDLDFANAISANIWSVSSTRDLNEISLYNKNKINFSEALEHQIEKTSFSDSVALTSKEQKIEILSVANNSILAEITDLQDIIDFLNFKRLDDWNVIKEIPDNAESVLTIVKYALQRKMINSQLDEQSRLLLYKTKESYYIEDKTMYFYTSEPNYELLRFFKIPNESGEYLEKYLE